MLAKVSAIISDTHHSSSRRGEALVVIVVVLVQSTVSLKKITFILKRVNGRFEEREKIFDDHNPRLLSKTTHLNDFSLCQKVFMQISVTS